MWGAAKRTGLVAAVLAFAFDPAWPSPGKGTDPLPTLDLPADTDRWLQVALHPHRFQADCLDSTTATYSLQEHDHVRVQNRCRTQNGWDAAEDIARRREGVERRAAGVVAPASLEVSFLSWLSAMAGRGLGQVRCAATRAGAAMGGGE